MTFKLDANAYLMLSKGTVLRQSSQIQTENLHRVYIDTMVENVCIEPDHRHDIHTFGLDSQCHGHAVLLMDTIGIVVTMRQPNAAKPINNLGSVFILFALV